MNFIKIEQFDTANGVGIGTVLWVAGCNHQCPCCHNPQTWDKNAGKLWEARHAEFLLETLQPDYITRLTLSGGDPMFPENRFEIVRILDVVRGVYPSKIIWLYTGYTFDEIKNTPVVQNKLVDVIVDGEFRIGMKDLNLPYRGSSNQHLIGLTAKGSEQIRNFQ